MSSGRDADESEEVVLLEEMVLHILRNVSVQSITIRKNYEFVEQALQFPLESRA
jgi:hypothetical protein